MWSRENHHSDPRGDALPPRQVLPDGSALFPVLPVAQAETQGLPRVGNYAMDLHARGSMCSGSMTGRDLPRKRDQISFTRVCSVAQEPAKPFACVQGVSWISLQSQRDIWAVQRLFYHSEIRSDMVPGHSARGMQGGLGWPLALGGHGPCSFRL